LYRRVRASVLSYAETVLAAAEDSKGVWTALHLGCWQRWC